jgi:A/G-specific adenine glycosylase
MIGPVIFATDSPSALSPLARRAMANPDSFRMPRPICYGLASPGTIEVFAVSSFAAVCRRRLLSWYDRERRDLPWRSPPGGSADPYTVWLSEIMLQQTTVSTVVPYFRSFTGRWPRVEDLAAAALDDVLRLWQGLGYYARARNLHACAVTVARDHGGRFPDTEEELLRLPGIGAYTAAAIAAIAFGRKATPVDGNVIRVIARLFEVETPLPGARADIDRLARPLTPDRRAGDFAQAMMDLGATVCVPRRPRCEVCPLNGQCGAFSSGRPEAFPVRASKKRKATRFGVAFWIERPDGSVLLRRRPEKGLLGGMMEIPSTEWREQPWAVEEAIRGAPAPGPWRRRDGEVRHTFTHFHLELLVLAGQSGENDGPPGLWCPVDRLSEHALPTLMKKVAALALSPAAGPAVRAAEARGGAIRRRT